MHSVLFVCLGNICRSPTAEAVFRKKACEAGLEVFIESAGTSGAHNGQTPDRRSMAAGEKRGYSFAGQTSRRVTQADLLKFDYVLAMDGQNLRDLDCLNTESEICKPRLFLDFVSESKIKHVPDPYYGGPQGFDHVLDLIEAASEGLIVDIRSNT